MDRRNLVRVMNKLARPTEFLAGQDDAAFDRADWRRRYGFNIDPFGDQQDPRFFHGSRAANKAQAHFHYGLRAKRGVVLLTGRDGLGKTVAALRLSDQADATRVAVGVFFARAERQSNGLSPYLDAFGVTPRGHGEADEIEAFEEFLLEQWNCGRRTVLVVDDADAMPESALTELAHLSGVEYRGARLLQVFLTAREDGAAGFRERLAAGAAAALERRIVADYALEPLASDEVRAYVERRIGAAGREGEALFDDAVFAPLYDASAGAPRTVNRLCAELLAEAAMADSAFVDLELARMVFAKTSAGGPIRDSESRIGDRAGRSGAAATPSAWPARVNSEAGMAGTEGPILLESVFDRVLAARARTADPSFAQKPATKATPKPATIEDVAEAIAAQGGLVDAPRRDDAYETLSADAHSDYIATNDDNVENRDRAEGLRAGAQAFLDEQSVAAANDAPSNDALVNDASQNDAATGDERGSQSSASDRSDGASVIDAEVEELGTVMSRVSEETPADLIAAPLEFYEDEPSWRARLTTAIASARGDLREAHATAARLKRRLEALEAQRRRSEDDIARSLERADEILSSLRATRP